jgi:hypothetical protein
MATSSGLEAPPVALAIVNLLLFALDIAELPALIEVPQTRSIQALRVTDVILNLSPEAVVTASFPRVIVGKLRVISAVSIIEITLHIVTGELALPISFHFMPAVFGAERFAVSDVKQALLGITLPIAYAIAKMVPQALA